MDPNATLAQLRELSKLALPDEANASDASEDLADAFNDATDRLAELANLFEALDGWIMKGGSLPKDWAQAYVRTLAEKEV